MSSQFYRETQDVRGLALNPNSALQKGKKYKCLNLARSTQLKMDFRFKPHQQRVIDYCTQLVSQKWWKDNRRGVLLYHTLGLGKTCTSIGIADQLLSTGQFQGVVVLLPASLRLNYVQEYCAKCGLEYVDQFSTKFSFYAYNYTGIINDFPKKLERVVIIVDELHNLIAGKMNNSRVRSQLFDTIAQSQNCFVIGLSGTPIYSSPAELYYYGELFLKVNKLHTWPEPDFNRDFFLSEILPNEKLVTSALEGVTSFVTPDGNENYPEIREDMLVMVPITAASGEVYGALRKMEENIATSVKCLKDTATPTDNNRFLFFEEQKDNTDQSLCYLAITKFFSTRLANIWYPVSNQVINKIPYAMRLEMGNPNRIIEYLFGLGFFGSESMSLAAYKMLLLGKEDSAFRFPGYELRSYNHEFHGTLTNPQGDAEQSMLGTLREKDENALGRLKQKPETLGQLGYYLFNDRDLSRFTTNTLRNLKNHPNIRYFEENLLKHEHSPKFWAVLQNIKTIPGKHAVFCHFKVNSGVYF